ncbi:hypothetical protein [Microcoleus phage My-WqHQDG]|nr:hypothetical protein [Microcoleus phage My-WqHQDG]
MLTETEETQVRVLLDNDSTPQPIKDLLSLLKKAKINLIDSSKRVEYLEGLARTIVQTPPGNLKTLSYMPNDCPRVPYLVPIEEPNEHPIPPELEDILYKGALELGLQLLLPMEAEAMLRGIQVGLSKDKEKVLPVILMISVGQQIREQQQQE